MNQKEREMFISNFIKFLSKKEILIGCVTNCDTLDRISEKEVNELIKEYMSNGDYKLDVSGK